MGRLSITSGQDFEAVYDYWLKSPRFNPKNAVILLDEIQEITGWEKWVNYFAQVKLHKVFFTGSNSKVLSSELATYLTGRHLDIYLSPLSFIEIVESTPDVTLSSLASVNMAKIQKLYETYQKYGGFPRPFIDQSLSYLPHYYSDILHKDIIARAKIRNKVAIESLARILATETSRLFNHSKIARLLKLKDEATVRKNCRLLVQTYLYYEVRCFSKSIRSQTRSHPKYYCIDHALAKSNGFWKTDDPTRILELIVCSELFRRGKDVFYWKSNKGFEIDFLIAEGNTPVAAIQVSYSIDDALTEERELRALEHAYQELGLKELIVITRQERRTIKTKNYQVKVIPITDFLLFRPH
jgi:predicted AAA+ superfamily ATPase